MMSFPKLYGLPSNGKKIKEWSVSVNKTENDCAVITRIHGFQECKMQKTKKEITKGKNIGKKNETTPYQQACNEAQSMWKKQVESGYKESIELLRNNQQLLPMLAFDFNKRGKDIQFPCYIQPKLDGVRLLAYQKENDVECVSRTGKVFEYLSHIQSDIKKLNLGPNMYIDGELFTFELPFEEISGLCRKQEKTDKVQQLEFHIFDIFDSTDLDCPFSKRHELLQDLSAQIKKHKLKSLKVVETSSCADKDQMLKFHQEYMMQTYEGVILRNADGPYQPGYRNKNIQKYKEFMDEEFEITGAESGVGLEQDCAIFTCKNGAGQEFSVRPRGSRELRKEYLRNIKSIIGKMLTVRYQNLSESGIVRFGVGIAIRDYE